MQSFLISAALAFLIFWAAIGLRGWVVRRARWDVKDRWYYGGAAILLTAIPAFPHGLNMLFLSSSEELAIYRVGRLPYYESLIVDFWGVCVGLALSYVLYQFAPASRRRS